MMRDTLRIGSRGSELALWQAHWVQRELAGRFSGLNVEIQIIKTKGDRILDSPLSKIGDKGLFTREIENALLKKTIDIAVHSLKDLPTEFPRGLSLGVVCKREDVRDVFIPHPRNPVKKLFGQPQGSRIATGSLRRKCQLLNHRPDFQIVDIRGNLNTRVKKLEESDWQGMILARAGVVRLGWTDIIGETLDPDILLPAVGQGALGIEIRKGDVETRECIATLHHTQTADAVTAERALLRRLEGGCQVPIGTYGRIREGRPDNLILDAMVGSLDGRRIVRGKITGASSQAEDLGRKLGDQLLAIGAKEILRHIRTGSMETEREAVDV